jgi:hypothetical protein
MNFELIEKKIEEDLKKEEQDKNNKKVEKIKKAKKTYLYEEKVNVYIASVNKYLKFKNKKHQFLRMKKENKFKYYINAYFLMGWKLFRKQLLWQLMIISAIAFANYIFIKTGLKDIIVTLFKRMFGWFKRKLGRK